MNETKECARCGETFYRPVNRSRKEWERRTLCSQKCVGRVAASFPRPRKNPTPMPEPEDPRVTVPTWDSHPDKGCHLHDRCVTCPFVDCVIEMAPDERRAYLRSILPPPEPRKWPRRKGIFEKGGYLTTAETLILTTLLDRPGMVPHPVIMREAIGYEFASHTGLRTHVRNLRRKLEPYGLDQWIVSKPGHGYGWREA